MQIIWRVFAWIMLAIGLFFAAMVLGSIWGVNCDWRPPAPTALNNAETITIYVSSNGFHTEFILPAQTAQHNWYALFPPEHVTRPPNIASHVIIGWGQSDFYLNTPNWSDADPVTMISASLGSDDTLMHVYHMGQPAITENTRPLRISAAQYRILVDNIIATLGSETMREPIKGYGARDVFYKATGRYSLINSCNEWTGQNLRQMGVRTGAWTPLAWSVMRWFPQDN